MQIPNYPTSGIGTTGATGLVILAGVIFSDLNSAWLILSIFLILMGIGQENKNYKYVSKIERTKL